MEKPVFESSKLEGTKQAHCLHLLLQKWNRVYALVLSLETFGMALCY